MKIFFLRCLIVFSVVLQSKNAGATSYTWTGASGSDWNNSANWSPSTGFPIAGDDVQISGTVNMPIVNVASACSTLTINGSVTITLLDVLNISGALTINNVGALTFDGNSSASIGGASNLAYNSSLVIGVNNSLTFPATSSISMAGNNLNTLVNNGDLQFLSSSLSMGSQAALINNGTLQLVSSSLSIGSHATLTNNDTCSMTSATVNLSGDSSTIANTSLFTADSSTINITGQQADITNSGAAATFTANNNSAINMGGYQAYINNSAIFAAGTSASACTITLTGQGNSSSPYSITNTGTFTVGSTSVINATGTDPSNPIEINNISGTFTLQSDANGSATIGPVGTGSSFVGTFNAERYITGGTLTYRGYRLLSSPVYASKVGSNNVCSINYLKNSIYLTGTTTSGGFDNVASANPTIYLYRENLTPLYTTFLNSNFRGINDINSSPMYLMDDSAYPSVNIPAGNGYLCFFRGNRTSDTYSNETVSTYVPQPVTLSAGGTLNQGQIVVADWFTPGTPALSFTSTSPSDIQGFNLVGNPYASSIDWETFQTSTPGAGIYGKALGSVIYVLDPLSKNYGAYAEGNFGVGTNNATNIIASGQAFFVLALDTTARLVFNESAKTNTQVTGLNLLMGKPAGQLANTQYLRLQLAKDSINNDDILLRFNANAGTTYSPTVDAPYLQGYGQVSLCSMSSDHVKLAVNVQPLPKTSEAICLSVNAKSDGIYTLNMTNLTGIPKLFDIWLMDRYKNDSLDMRLHKTYSFNISKGDSATFGTKRFALVIRQNPAYAYQLLNFTADKITGITNNANKVQLVWNTENEQNYTNFTIERSINNGKTFDVIGGMVSGSMGTYSLLDNSPVIGQNIYRLKQEDINNSISYSEVITVKYSDISGNLVKNAINLYPNPAKNTISLTISKDLSAATTYNIQITNSSGLLVRQAISAQPNWQANVGDLLPGTYIINVLNNKDNTLVGNTKFIKL